MRQKTSQWFETKVRYDKTMEDGQMKKITEAYVVEALSFSEAETMIIEEMQAYISGEFDVKAITPAVYREIFFSDADLDDKWFKARLAFLTLDADSGKEKRTYSTFLVQAASVNGAIKHVDKVMGETLNEYMIVSVTDTKLMDVFEHNLGEKAAANQPEYEQ